MSIDLNNYLPANLTNDFWKGFLESVSEELELYKQVELDVMKNFYYTRELNDIEQLLEIATTYGLVPDRSLDNSIAYMKLVDDLINYKVKYKTSYTGYDLIFKAVNTLGYVYNLYIDNSMYVRGLNGQQVITNLDMVTDYSLPFTGFVPEYFFTVDSNTLDSLDAGDFYLDTGTRTLDEVYVNNPTGTLSAEYTPINLFTEDSVEYYMTVAQLDYLNRGVLYNKKVAEMMQIGFQVNALMDTSGNLDGLSGAGYSTPDLKLDCALVGTLSGVDITDFYEVVVGSGQQALPSTSNPISPPTALANQFYSSTDDVNQVEDATDWKVISGRSLFIDESSFTPEELEEELTIQEIGIRNQSGDLILYATFPEAIIKKKYHLSFQFYVKK